MVGPVKAKGGRSRALVLERDVPRQRQRREANVVLALEAAAVVMTQRPVLRARGCHRRVSSGLQQVLPVQREPAVADAARRGLVAPGRAEVAELQ